MNNIPNLIFSIILVISVLGIMPFLIDKKYSKKALYTDIKSIITPTLMIIVDCFILMKSGFLYNFIIEKSGCGASSGCIEEVSSIIIGLIIFLLLLFVKYIILKLSRKSKKYIIISFSWVFVLIITLSLLESLLEFINN